MADERPGPGAKAPDPFEKFLRTAANAQGVTSPGGKVLARRFALSPEAMAATLTYPMADRQRIVGQLRTALSSFYVHLARKASQFGFDPVRALDLLEPTLDGLTDGEFHQSVVELIARTRDRHLAFYGRAPFGVSAVLPFTVERFFDAGDERYAVTKIAAGFVPDHLQAGALVTHWNGIPIRRFVRLNANVFDGGNEAASLARSLAFLTSRPLTRFAAPLEEWVDLRFTLQGTAYEERFTWQGLDATNTPVTPSVGQNVTGFGGDLELMHLQHSQRVRFAPRSFDGPAPAPSNERGVPQIVGQHVAVIGGAQVDVFDYGSVTTDDGTFGYVRLWNFQADQVDDIANALVAAFAQIPRAGLIIDIRGNSGGYVAAGEHVLQLLTPARVTPTRFQFRVTPATRATVKTTGDFAAWGPSMEEAADTGEPFSQGFPIEGTDEDFNRIGQKYYGPVVLVTDALAFSTADMFAAGFIDHAVGRVICIDKNMAAAGGNNWTWDVVRLYNPDFRLDPAFRQTLDAGKLSDALRDAFNRAGASLSAGASVSTGADDQFGRAWRITDGFLGAAVRSVSSFGDPLLVYLDRSPSGLADLPAGIQFGLTLRRCVRIRRSEGRLLEDLGIQPDVVYQMTLRDVMDRNRDLITRATKELSQMNVYDLQVQVGPRDSGFVLVCATRNLTSLEVRSGERDLTAAAVSGVGSTELLVPEGVSQLEVRGLDGDTLAAKALVAIPH